MANDKQRAPIQQDCANEAPASLSASPTVDLYATATAMYPTELVPKIFHFATLYRRVESSILHIINVFIINGGRTQRCCCFFSRSAQSIAQCLFVKGQEFR